MAVYGMVRHPSWLESSGSVHGSGRYASGAFYRLIKKSPSGNGALAQKVPGGDEFDSRKRTTILGTWLGSCVIPPVLRFSD